MKKGVAGMRKRIGAWILTLVMIAGLAAVPAGEAKAESVEVDLHPDTTQTTQAVSGTTLDVNFTVPKEYDTFSELQAAGLTKLEVTFQATAYQEEGTAGAQAFIGFGEGWKSQWINLTKGQEQTVALDLSAYLSDSGTISKLGLQFANVTGDITYQIKSAKLTGTRWEVGDDTVNLSYTAQDQYDSYTEYKFTLRNDGAAPVTGDLVITFDKDREKNWWTEEVSIGLNGNVLTVSNVTVPANGETKAIQVQLKPTGAAITSVTFAGKGISASGKTLTPGNPGGGGSGSGNDDFTGSLTYDLPDDCTDDADTTPFSQHGALHVDPTTLKLTDANGNPYQLRGVSTHGINWDSSNELEYQYVNYQSFKKARDILGASAVRLAMYTAEYNGYLSGGNQDQLKYRVDKGVKCATALGLYAIVDWHILNANPKTNVDEAKTYFDYMSKQYAGYDNILYEICNEPTSGIWSDIKSYAEAVIPVIRKNDPDAVIIVGTPTWSQDVDIAKNDPLKDADGSLMDNVMYTVHFYAATHGQSYRNKVTAALGTIPIFCTEFGMTESSGDGPNNFSEATAWLDFLDENCISYFVWNLSEKPETSSLMQNGSQTPETWTEDNLSESGKWIKEQYSARKAVNNITSTVSVPLTGITVSPATMTLTCKETGKLTVKPNPSNAKIKEVTYKSDEPTVAGVSSNGTVTAKAKGTAKITITAVSAADDSECTAECTVKVVNPVTSFALKDSDITLEKGEEKELQYTISPEDPDEYTIEWQSKNSEVATVENGKVQAVGKGVTTITATLKSGSQTFTKECKVTVTVPLDGISIAPKTLELQLHGDNSTAKLAVTPIPDDADLGDVQWSVSPENVVTIEEDGSGASVEIKAVAKGKAVITAIAGGKSAECSVTVTNSVTGIRLPATLEVLMREADKPIDLSEQLEYIPEDADGQKVNWTSSNPDAIQVDPNGIVTIKKKEKSVTAKITATLASNEDIETVCTISIVETPVESITVAPEKMYLSVNRTMQLTATVEPKEADNAGNIQWVSLNPDVASVDEEGKVTALKEGEAKIQASAGNEKASCTVTVLDPYTIDVSKLGDPGYADALVSDDNSPTVSYDSENKKLTLKEPTPSKYTITGENDEVTIVTGDEGEYDVTLKDATVKQVDVSASTKGKMHIEGQVTVKEGIVAGKADVEIDGTGTLNCPYIETEGSVTIKDVTLNADASATEKPAISGKDVTIENATVDAVGGKSSPAIQADEKLTITGGKVTAETGKTAPALTGQEVVMEGKSEVDVDTEENQKAIEADRIVIDDATVKKDGAPAPDDIYSVPPVDREGNLVNDPSHSEDDPSSGNDTPTSGGNTPNPGGNTPNPGGNISDPDDDVNEAEELVVTANVRGVSNISAKGTLKLAPKKTMTLKVSFLPAGAETEKVTFKSSNTKIAKVSSKGKITAGKKAGKATITVKSDSFKKTFKVQVMKKAISKIKIKASKTTIKKKKTVKLKAVLSPGKKLASDTVCWKSSNKKIATVSSKGVVKGIKKGTVKITAIATDGSGKKKTIRIRVK